MDILLAGFAQLREEFVKNKKIVQELMQKLEKEIEEFLSEQKQDEEMSRRESVLSKISQAIDAYYEVEDTKGAARQRGSEAARQRGSEAERKEGREGGRQGGRAKRRGGREGGREGGSAACALKREGGSREQHGEIRAKERSWEGTSYYSATQEKVARFSSSFASDCRQVNKLRTRAEDFRVARDIQKEDLLSSITEACAQGTPVASSPAFAPPAAAFAPPAAAFAPPAAAAPGEALPSLPPSLHFALPLLFPALPSPLPCIPLSLSFALCLQYPSRRSHRVQVHTAIPVAPVQTFSYARPAPDTSKDEEYARQLAGGKFPSLQGQIYHPELLCPPLLLLVRVTFGSLVANSSPAAPQPVLGIAE
eukprot:763020-Hanusia_phi.AAC.17